MNVFKHSTLYGLFIVFESAVGTCMGFPLDEFYFISISPSGQL
jgi:hypothetical protein